MFGSFIMFVRIVFWFFLFTFRFFILLLALHYFGFHTLEFFHDMIDTLVSAGGVALFTGFPIQCLIDNDNYTLRTHQ